MKLIVAICALLTLGVSPSPHKFENGFVERTMSVIVRSDTAYVEYSVGLNEPTLIDVLSEWKAESNPEATSAPQSGKARPTSRNQSQSTSSESIEIAKSDQPTQSDSDSGTPESAVDLPGETLNQSDDSASHTIDDNMLEEFRKLSLAEIPRRLAITLDGQPVVVNSVSEGVAPRHPYTLSIKFQFKIPETKSSDLHIADSNFSQQTGAVRYALKASGDAMLLRSNVAPV